MPSKPRANPNDTRKKFDYITDNIKRAIEYFELRDIREADVFYSMALAVSHFLTPDEARAFAQENEKVALLLALSYEGRTNWMDYPPLIEEAKKELARPTIHLMIPPRRLL